MLKLRAGFLKFCERNLEFTGAKSTHRTKLALETLELFELHFASFAASESENVNLCSGGQTLCDYVTGEDALIVWMSVNYEQSFRVEGLLRHRSTLSAKSAQCLFVSSFAGRSSAGAQVRV
jgi:hypothetical protein